MPKYRKEIYAVYRACERFGIRPPGVSSSWDEMSPLMQATLIAYSQIREYEEYENLSNSSQR